MLLHSFIVAKGEGKQTLAAYLRTKLKLTWTKAKEIVSKKQVRVAGQPTTDPAHRLRVGNRVDVHGFSAVGATTTTRKKPQFKKPAPVHEGPMPKIVYEDDAIVVVDKPAGMTTMRHAEEAAEFGERGKHFLPSTLADLLPDLLGQPGKTLRPVHRIDRDTSGVVIFARSVKAEKALNTQFREHTVERRYLALVRGQPKAGRIESSIVRDRGDGRRGSSPTNAEDGQKAITHVKVIEGLGDFTLIECRLETGRTHQVRIHLGEQGTPLCGERIYDRPTNGKPHPDDSGAERTMLHAAKLGIRHPDTEDKMSWSSPLPEDMAQLLERLREEEFKISKS
ncbi:MAG: RluA family pseudouridine synthase [Planctomycetes bacterium]|nr:RluA family pseudouridine synthase [Planctomycetota bacterium]